MILIKNTVKLYRMKPEMGIVHSVVACIFAAYDVDCVLTSVMDSKHMIGTLHSAGYAIDYRTKGLSHELKSDILKDIKAALPMCDCLLEDEGGINEHLHIEHDPKWDSDFQRDKEVYKATGQWPEASHV